MTLTNRGTSPVRCLVVDDFEEWRQRIRSILKTRPELQVIGEASDGLEAVQKAKELKPDVILLDISLPTLSGLDVASRLSHLVPGSKILFVSTHSDADVVRAALSNGALGFVLKTDAESQLLPGIEAVLRGHRFVSSGIKKEDNCIDTDSCSDGEHCGDTEDTEALLCGQK